jgi:hypothetical protein
MERKVIYTNKDNEDFIIEQSSTTLKFEILSGSSSFYFLDFEEVQDFCQMLTSEAIKTFNINVH